MFLDRAPLTPQQQKALQRLRNEINEEKLYQEGDTLDSDDRTLLRFLRARDFDVKTAKKMLVDCLKWRRTVEDIGIDELYRRIDPFDLGRPLNVHFIGGINLPELYKDVTPERHWQTIIVNAESLVREVLPACSAEAGRHINQALVIADLSGFRYPPPPFLSLFRNG
ncbi:hypothetical protein EW146_g10503 [Bondarzewia mesenterica]|uniref:CRAL/TRIO N-terminal domain-containing protein n=1 Tax=Bondarzewia mesenterica TaxID=1095465 RepID=A0A4V3XBS4_9AGAM|nr:hypothetical protein EW146_g10503 [Bondarzewia mesenterica]